MRKRERKERRINFTFSVEQLRNRSNMSLALHGHHVLLIATLAFIAAVLTPYWYTSPDQTLHIDIFKICNSSLIPSQCPWTYSLLANSSHFGASKFNGKFFFSLWMCVLSLFKSILSIQSSFHHVRLVVFWWVFLVWYLAHGIYNDIRMNVALLGYSY